jgi:hypothetical protein
VAGFGTTNVEPSISATKSVSYSEQHMNPPYFDPTLILFLNKQYLQHHKTYVVVITEFSFSSTHKVTYTIENPNGQEKSLGIHSTTICSTSIYPWHNVIILFIFQNKEMTVHSLKVMYHDPFHEAELKTFSNRCMRKSSLQTLIRGVVSYAELFANREEIADWLIEENEPHFSVHKLHEDGAYNIQAEGRSISYFSCVWRIIWNEGSMAMMPSLTIRANNESKLHQSDCLPLSLMENNVV